MRERRGLVREQLRHEARLHDDLGARQQACRLGVRVAAKPGDCRWRSERLGQVGHRGEPDPTRDEEGLGDVEVEAVSERAEDVDRLAGREGTERAGSRADRVDEERELTRRRLAEAHRARQQAPGRLEHEELTGDAGLERSPLETDQRIRADRLVLDDREQLAPGVHASIPIRSCSESADSARAFAIACTAAAAPEIVVTHGTRATSAASRMR